MTKLNISIPDNSQALVNTIKELVAKAGGFVSVEDNNVDELKADFQESLNQALDIIEGKAKGRSLREALND